MIRDFQYTEDNRNALKMVIELIGLNGRSRFEAITTASQATGFPEKWFYEEFSRIGYGIPVVRSDQNRRNAP